MFAAATLLCGSAGAANVSGNVQIPAGSTVPSGAVVQVELRDVSRADAAAMLIGSKSIRDAAGKGTVPFSVAYDTAKINQGNTYAVSARITQKGKLLFINDTQIPVITRGSPVKDVSVPVTKVH